MRLACLSTTRGGKIGALAAQAIEAEELVYNGSDKPLTPRLKRADMRSAGGLTRLHMMYRGAIGNLAVEPLPPLGDSTEGTVEISVHAVGLNFRDVLNVLGAYPGDPGPPGSDAAGVLTASNERAFGFADAPLASLARGNRHLLVPAPSVLSFERMHAADRLEHCACRIRPCKAACAACRPASCCGGRRWAGGA